MALNGIVANSQNHIQLPRFPSESNSNVGNSFYLPHPVTFKSFQERFPEIKNPSREKVLEFAKQQAALSVQKVLKMQRGDREIEAMIPLSPIISVREAEGMPGPEAMSLFSRANNMQIENLLGVTKSGRKYYFAFEYPSKEVVSSAKPVERLLPSTLGAITPAAAITRIGDLARRAEPPWARKDYWDSRTGWKNYTWHPDKDFQGLLPTYGGYRLEKIGRSYVDNKNFIWQEFKMIPKLGKLPTEIRLLRYKAN